MDALITGSNGFVGRWLSCRLKELGYKVYGFDCTEKSQIPDIEYTCVNITDNEKLTTHLQIIQPDLIFHLAAVSYLPAADHSPRKAMEINIIGTLSLLDAIRNACPKAKALFVGSSKQYDDAINAENITETTLPNPKNFYAISKYSGELLGLQYARQFGLNLFFTRSFNHTGPGQSPLFVCSDWAKQIVQISLNNVNPFITVGNIESVIDFSDVRDVIGAYIAILEKGTPGEVYNVCSSKGTSLEWILEYLISKASRPVTIQRDTGKLRGHNTNRFLIGSNEKLRKHTGWECSIKMEKTLDDLYEYWVKELTK